MKKNIIRGLIAALFSVNFMLCSAGIGNAQTAQQIGQPTAKVKIVPSSNFTSLKPANEQVTALGTIAPPHPESGHFMWPDNITVWQIHVMQSLKPNDVFGGEYVGWLQAHLMAFSQVPSQYAGRSHSEWLRLLSGYGILGNGAFWADPFFKKARQSAFSKIISSGGRVTEENIRAEGIWKNVWPAQLVKSESFQDSLILWASPAVEATFQSMPKTHRAGYIQIAQEVFDTVKQATWFANEKRYFESLRASRKEGDFILKNPDGKDNPFRPLLAFMYRRVNDGTLSWSRAAWLAESAKEKLALWENRVKEARQLVHGPDKSDSTAKDLPAGAPMVTEGQKENSKPN